MNIAQLTTSITKDIDQYVYEEAKSRTQGKESIRKGEPRSGQGGDRATKRTDRHTILIFCLITKKLTYT